VPIGEWTLMQQQASALAQSDIIPSAYKRRPANILVAAITGRHYGWDVLTAMRNGHVIEGAWGMKPEAMLGLVRQAGHSVRGDIGSAGASVTGIRADNGDSMTVSFTVEDAVAAGLCALRDGKPFARSRNGQPLPWETYPSIMCYWRAVGLLCRVLFSDLTAGVHSAEEMGAAISEDGDVIDVGEIEMAVTPAEPMPLSDEALAKFREACEQIGAGTAEVLAHAFPDGVPDVLTDEHLPAMRDAYRHLTEEIALEGATTDEQVVGESEQPEARPATRTQVGKIKGEYARLGVEDRDAQLRSTTDVVGRGIGSHNDLTTDEAAALIDYLVRLDATDEGVLFVMGSDGEPQK
jgi:hypothetical protein